MEQPTDSAIDTRNERQMKEVAERCGRHYKTSSLPVFRDGVDAPARNEDLKWLYGEICNSWRTLTDVRFKLLGLVPALAGVVLIAVLSQDGPAAGLSATVRTGIIVFGFLATFALFIYERRNSQLYDDLISRGRRIEDELGIDTGQFRGRKDASSKLISHDVATNLIYSATLAAWLFALAATWFGWL